VPTLAHGLHPGNAQVLRVLARGNRIPVEGFGLQTCAGVYAKVISPGGAGLATKSASAHIRGDRPG
jgi:hypothetical protein